MSPTTTDATWRCVVCGSDDVLVDPHTSLSGRYTTGRCRWCARLMKSEEARKRGKAVALKRTATIEDATRLHHEAKDAERRRLYAQRIVDGELANHTWSPECARPMGCVFRQNQHLDEDELRRVVL